MADSKLTGLTATTAPVAADLLYIVTDVSGTPTSKKVTLASLFTSPPLTGPVTITEAVGSSGLTITGATQTSSFPALSITQTWNNAGTTFDFIKAVATSTASAAASSFLDYTLAGTSNRVNISKLGTIVVTSAGSANANITIDNSDNHIISARSNAGQSYQLVGDSTGSGGSVEFRLGASGLIGWNSATYLGSGSRDVFLRREAAGVLSLRNSTNAQEQQWYETYTDASNYERGVIRMGSDTMTLAWETAGTGSDNGGIALTPAGTGIVTVNSGLRTAAPAGGTAATWKFGIAATVSPLVPNRTIELDIGGTIYYLHAKTTND